MAVTWSVCFVLSTEVDTKKQKTTFCPQDIYSYLGERKCNKQITKKPYIVEWKISGYKSMYTKHIYRILFIFNHFILLNIFIRSRVGTLLNSEAFGLYFLNKSNLTHSHPSN